MAAFLLAPKISGPEVLRKLKESPVTAAIPVIVLSSLSQTNEKKLLEEGAVAYFEESALDLDKNSVRLTAIVETVLCRNNRQREGSEHPQR